MYYNILKVGKGEKKNILLYDITQSNIIFQTYLIRTDHNPIFLFNLNM